MWNPTIFFSMFSMSVRHSFKISCSSWNQWCHWFQEELLTDYPMPFPLFSWQASAMLVLRGFFGSGRPKTSCYWILYKKKKLSDTTDNNLGDLASSVLFCDAMHPGTCKHCKNGYVSRTNQKTQLSLSICHKLRNLLLQLTTVTINTD